MNVRDCIKKAERHRVLSNSAIAPLNKKLEKLLDDRDASVFHQESDGWVVLFSGDHNAAVINIDFDDLLKMGKDEALLYLMDRSI